MPRNRMHQRHQPHRGCRERQGNRRGAILVIVALFMISFMGLLVLVVDVGSLQRQKRMAQTAADAGARAGADEIFRNRSADEVGTAVRTETERNGFKDGDGVTVT